MLAPRLTVEGPRYVSVRALDVSYDQCDLCYCQPSILYLFETTVRTTVMAHGCRVFCMTAYMSAYEFGFAADVSGNKSWAISPEARLVLGGRARC